jgi:hypothetical protein
MSVFDDILANGEVPDDMEITVGDKAFKIGDARGALKQEREQREALTRERDEVRGKYGELETNVGKILGLAGRQTDAENERPAPQDPKEALREALRPLLEKDDGTSALMEDKLFGKALTAVEERAFQRAMKGNEALKTEFNQLKELVEGGFRNVTQAQLSERAERWYDVNRADIPKGQDGKRVSLKQIHDYAAERGIVRPNTNLIDYDRTLEMLTEPARRKDELTAAEEKAYQRGVAAGRTGAAKVIPLMGDRSAGGIDAKKFETTGKSAKQIVSERLQQGLSELSAEEG